MTEIDKTTEVIQVIKAETEAINQIANSNERAAKIVADAIETTKTDAAVTLIETIQKFIDIQSNFDWLALITLIAAIVAAFAYSMQAIAMRSQVIEFEKQTRLMIDRRAQEKFEDAINKLDIKLNNLEWFIALKTIENIAINQAKERYDDCLNVLLLAGKKFSENIFKFTETKFDGIPPEIKDQNRFVYEVLKTILKINNHPSTISYNKPNSKYKKYVIVEGFCIALSRFEEEKGIAFYNITDQNFEQFTFRDCNFKGVNFFNNIMINCAFRNCKNIKISGSLVDYNPYMTNNLSDLHDPDYNILIGRCYIWDNDRTTLGVLKHKIYDFEMLDATQYRESWEDKMPRTVPETHWSTWVKETKRSDGVFHNIQDI